MKNLWAPWRMDFITGDKEAGCIFCTRAERHNDSDDLILERGKTCFVMLNKFPYSNGHLMMVPYLHTDDLGQLDAATSTELMSHFATWRAVMASALQAQGFNIGMNLGDAAGAGVKDHLHFHLVPRWVGDTNFMPVFSDTRVLPEALAQTYAKLKQAREEL